MFLSSLRLLGPNLVFFKISKNETKRDLIYIPKVLSMIYDFICVKPSPPSAIKDFVAPVYILFKSKG